MATRLFYLKLRKKKTPYFRYSKQTLHRRSIGCVVSASARTYRTLDQAYRIIVRPHDEWFLFYLSSPKPGHTRGDSGRGARRCGGAGSGRTGRRQNSSPKRKPSLVPSKASKPSRLNVSPKARTSEILCKPMEEHNDRLTTG